MYKDLRKTYVAKIDRFKKLLLRHQYGSSINFTIKYAQTSAWVEFAKREQLEYKSIQEGDSWGTAWESAWFHLSAEIPEQLAKQPLAARIQLNSEILMFDDHGCPIYALTNASAWDAAFVKDRYLLEKAYQAGDKLELWLEAACNGLFGIAKHEDPELTQSDLHGSFEGKVHYAKLSVWNAEVHELMLDVEVLFDLLRSLNEESPRYNKILRKLNQAINCYAETPSNAYLARQILAPLINNGANTSSLTAYAIGHAHLDTGWLWPVKESIRKTARTFAHQIHLMEQYPEYVFGASQPQHFKFIQDYYPQLYTKVKHYVASGQFEVQGAMWVEADCNLISGESMIRQLMWGKNYFKREFGVEINHLWLPDVFGYSANLPQLLKKSGVDYFITQKISWNQYNTFPHHTFIWRGIDGSEILSHFLPANNYNGYVTPKELIAAEQRFSENDVLDEFLYLYGIGDGGGGPKAEHIQYGQRLHNTEGVPKVKFAKATDFIDQIKDKTADLERWVGELYLELHRGTLTTQAQTKLFNRRLESWLKTLEAACSCLAYTDYPQAKFNEIYPLLLVNQFHDIIPGSSINLVYQEAQEKYLRAFAIADEIIQILQQKLLTSQANNLLVFNPTSFDLDGVIELTHEYAQMQFSDANNHQLVSQLTPEGKVLLALVKPIPPYSFANFSYQTNQESQSSSTNQSETSNLVLENDLVRYTFAPSGQIIEAYDKQTQQYFLTTGNRLSVYIDRPSNWDAWDVDYDYQQMEVISLVAHQHSLINGSVAQILSFNYQFANSTMHQEIRLMPHSKLLDFINQVNWQERHKMLRVAFDTTLNNPRANFDIQYGYVERPTHRNTSWDLAKFETVGQKYVDLSSLDYGVALLNNCKYGHKLFDQTIDLNLLRAPTDPDPVADLGDHEFKFALYPHQHSLAYSDVYHQASIYNALPLMLNNVATNSSTQLPWQIIQQDGVSIEVVKQSEEANCLVLRLHEYRGRNGTLNLQFNRSIQITPTNLIEWDDQESFTSKELLINLTPFELVTYKLWF
ncbi:MAG: hypothetical protein RLZZ293_527 [Pseudomonadota bacterium]|jgi:alpha-mannosidase